MTEQVPERPDQDEPDQPDGPAPDVAAGGPAPDVPASGSDGRRPVPDVPPPPAGHWPLTAGGGPGTPYGQPYGGQPYGPPLGQPYGGTAAGGSTGRVPPPPGVRLAGIGLSLAAIGVYLVSQLGVSLLAGIVLIAAGLVDPEALDPNAAGSALLGVVVLSQVLGLAAALLLLRRRGVPLRPVLGPVRPLGRLIAIGAGVGVVTLIASTTVVGVLVSISGSEATPDQVLTGDIADTPMQLLLAALAAVVMAPIAEEVLFRGLLHRGLRVRLTIVPATIISSVLFAVIHVEVVFSQPLALVGLTLAGAVMALAYERTGSLVVPVVIHAVYNALTLLAVVAVSRIDTELLAGPLAGPVLRATEGAAPLLLPLRLLGGG